MSWTLQAKKNEGAAPFPPHLDSFMCTLNIHVKLDHAQTISEAKSSHIYY